MEELINITSLAFNYFNKIFIENLSSKIKLLELENFLKLSKSKHYFIDTISINYSF